MKLFTFVAKTLANIILIPVDVTLDTATLGGLCTGKDEAYTSKRLKDLYNTVDNVAKDKKD